jgi:hypothetical protein
MPKPKKIYYGIYRGVVLNNVDPKLSKRLLVQLPALAESPSNWAEPCMPVGKFALPAVGAGVWIMFEEGDPLRPVWVGARYQRL